MSDWSTWEDDISRVHLYAGGPSGNDANNGLTSATPKATIAAVTALLTNGLRATIHLYEQDWTEQLGQWKWGGESASQRMIVTRFGPGSRLPKIKTSASDSALSFTGGGGSPALISHLVIDSIEFEAQRVDGTEKPIGLNVLLPVNNLRFEGCRWDSYQFNVNINAVDDGIDGIYFYRCHNVNSYCTNDNSSGFFLAAASTNGAKNITLDECILDHNGWNESVVGAGASGLNHNLYSRVGTNNLKLLYCVSSRGSSHGFNTNYGSTMWNCFVPYCGVGILCRSMGDVVRWNVVYGGRDVGAAPHGDFSDIKGRFDEDGSLGAPMEFSDNLLIHRDLATSTAANHGIEIVGNNGTHTSTFDIKRNIIYNTQTYGTVFDAESAGGDIVNFIDNDIQNPNDTEHWVMWHTPASAAGHTFRNTAYYLNADPGDWFFWGGSNFDDAVAWAAFSGEIGYTTTQKTYTPNKDKLLGDYMLSKGETGTVARFYALSTGMTRLTWNSNWTAPSVNAYFRDNLAKTGYYDYGTPAPSSGASGQRRLGDMLMLLVA